METRSAPDTTIFPCICESVLRGAMVDGLSAAIAGELEDWEETWKLGRRPYFIHYTGGRTSSQFAISRIFFDYLTEPEREELMAAEEEMNKQSLHLQKWPLPIRLLNRLVRVTDHRFYVQPKPYDVLREETVEQ